MDRTYHKKIIRLMTILSQLSSREGPTTAKLAKDFNVNRRTVQRDVELLSEAGFPVFTENGIHKFAEGFSLKKIVVTPEEKLLLTLFYGLFSKSGKPFNEAAKKLLDKVLLSSESLVSDFDEKDIKMIKSEFNKYSSFLADRLDRPKYSQPFIEKIDEYLSEVKAKLDKLNRKKKANVFYKLSTEYENGEPFALIKLPKQYFKDGIEKIEHFENVCVGLFTIKAFLPSADNKTFRRVLCLDLFINSSKGHVNEKNITCFDDFAEYIDFPRESREFGFKYRCGTRSGKLAVIGQLFWRKEIPMPAEDMKRIS